MRRRRHRVLIAAVCMALMLMLAVGCAGITWKELKPPADADTARTMVLQILEAHTFLVDSPRIENGELRWREQVHNPNLSWASKTITLGKATVEEMIDRGHVGFVVNVRLHDGTLASFEVDERDLARKLASALARLTAG